MKIHLKLLTERYWFRLGLSLCFAITAALSYADRDFIWMGLSLCLLLFSIWWQLSLYRIHTKRVLFMIDALENNDSAIHFPEEQIMPETREVNRALNRVGRILYNVKSETVQQEKYYELIMDCVNTGVLVLNENGAVYQKNNEALRLLGLNVFTHIRQLNKVDIQLMKKIDSAVREIKYKLFSTMNGVQSIYPFVYQASLFVKNNCAFSLLTTSTVNWMKKKSIRGYD